MSGRSEEPAGFARSLRQDVVAGLLFIAFGVSGYFFSLSLSVGTPSDLGSAAVPRIVSVLLVLFGLGIAVGGIVRSRVPVSFASARPLVIVTACVVLFSLMLETLGLVAAIMSMVAVSGFAGERMRPLTIVVLGAALSFACVAIFIWGAQLPIRVWPV
jgi:hypothetical protein